MAISSVAAISPVSGGDIGHVSTRMATASRPAAISLASSSSSVAATSPVSRMVNTSSAAAISPVSRVAISSTARAAKADSTDRGPASPMASRAAIASALPTTIPMQSIR